MSENEYDSVSASVSRIQAFDSNLLVRPELGSALSFAAAASTANHIITFFRQIPLRAVTSIPLASANQIQGQADAVFSIFDQIINFDPTQHGNQIQARDDLLGRLKSSYVDVFNNIHPLVSFLATRERDTSAFEMEVRAIAQSAKDNAENMSVELSETASEAKRILGEVRELAAEHGVSQMAEYFKTEASAHETEAAKWLEYSVKTAIGLGAYALLSFFIPRIPWLTPVNTTEAIQLGISKTLVFGVIAYMLYLCVRNLLAHRHNAVVNKHRQNALLTFRAMADATSNDLQRDAVVMSAASCIYSPQDTGYTKGSAMHGPGPQLIEVLPRMMGASQA